jgi:hydroxylamine reductase
MFCYQCQETAKGTGCTIKGVCGKEDDLSALQDLLIYELKGISLLADKSNDKIDSFIINGLFMTITNANFDKAAISAAISEAQSIKKELLKNSSSSSVHDAAQWIAGNEGEYISKGNASGVLLTENEDVRSLRELVIYGLKGIAAYLQHANVLGKDNIEISTFIRKALAATLDDSLSVDDLVALVLECGKFGVDAMAILDEANTSTYGDPEVTTVTLEPGTNPGILVSGHDLKDLEMLLEQTKDSGVDVYTHGEMLPAHYYPEFKKYSNFIGHYGNAWWQQKEEFGSFNGPILMTTNCIVPPKDSYIGRMYTTGAAGYEGMKYIDENNGAKDFSAIIEQAKSCKAPVKIESGSVTGGFAHKTIDSVAGTVVDAIKKGAIKKFFVMAGCDGRQKDRNYYTEFAQELPDDTVILTAGCAKFRYNKLDLGDIGGIPRVLDAGQCNDSYSLALTALKLKEAFELEDINDLPISYNIAWYEQKAVIVLLALLFLGVKNIHLGPTLPAFLSPNVANVLIENFGIGGITNVQDDNKMFLGA